jgi:hypothetical protein
MDISGMIEYYNPYKEVSLRTHLIWVTIVTIANRIPIEETISKFIISYLAIVVWLLIIMNKNRSLVQRVAILAVYLEFNTINKIIENLSYSVIVTKMGMLCVSLGQIISNNINGITRSIILLYFIMIATYLPDGKEVELKLTKKVIRYLQQ